MQYLGLSIYSGIVYLNRSRKDWHRQFLFGNTVFVKKTVPKETVCAFDYRT
jgi:hypothetical protein